MIIYDRPAPPSFACAHFEIGGVAAAACSTCGLLAPRSERSLRTITEVRDERQVDP